MTADARDGAESDEGLSVSHARGGAGSDDDDVGGSHARDGDGSDEAVQRAPHWAMVQKGASPSVAIGAWMSVHAGLLCLLVFHGSLHDVGLSYAYAFLVSTCAAAVFYARLVLSDPGYVHKDVIAEQLAMLRARGPDHAQGDVEALQLLGSQADQLASCALTASVSVTGEELREYFCGYCDVCELPRPNRSRHCKHCGRCVWRYDHHCFLISNCVGEANHPLFWWFLTAQCASLWLGIPLVRMAISPDGSDFLEWLGHNGPLFACALIQWPFIVLVVSLLVMHTLMAMVNITSFESAKREHLHYLRGIPECAFPFAHVLPCITLAHFCSMLCARRPGTLAQRPPPVSAWPGTCWRNRHYACL